MNTDAKILNKIPANRIQQHIKKYHASSPSGVYPRDARILQYSQTINVIHHIDKLKDKNHMITSIDVEKAFDKFQDPFMIKTFQKACTEGTSVQFSSVHSVVSNSLQTHES